MNTIDLHTHSHYSDGALSPSELVKYATLKGIRVLALTDHDTVAGLHEAIECGKEYNIDIISGIEVTAGDESGEYHILGYYVAWEDPLFVKAVQRIWNSRRDRTVRILENLTTAGFPIAISDVEATVGYKWHDRKDIARTLVALGYLTSYQQAFTDKLVGLNSPLYVPVPVVAPKDAIQLILSGGGIPVLAHPGTRPGGRKDAYPISKSKIAEFLEWGLKGLEVYYSRHSQETVIAYKRIADELGLIATGGSDFHRVGPQKPDIGQSGVPIRAVELLKGMVAKLHSKPEEVMTIKAILFDFGDTLVDEEYMKGTLDEVTVVKLPHADAVLASLARSYELGLLTNTRTWRWKEVRHLLQEAGWDSFFSCVVTSVDVSSWKPHHRIFRKAMQLLGVKPSECVVVGNKITTDIVGGNRIGAKTVLFRWNDRYPFNIRRPEDRPSLVIETLEQLPAAISELQRQLDDISAQTPEDS